MNGEKCGNALDRTLKGKQSLLKAKFKLKGGVKGRMFFEENKMPCREYFFRILKIGENRNGEKIEMERSYSFDKQE